MFRNPNNIIATGLFCLSLAIIAKQFLLGNDFIVGIFYGLALGLLFIGIYIKNKIQSNVK